MALWKNGYGLQLLQTTSPDYYFLQVAPLLQAKLKPFMDLKEVGAIFNPEAPNGWLLPATKFPYLNDFLEVLVDIDQPDTGPALSNEAGRAPVHWLRYQEFRLLVLLLPDGWLKDTDTNFFNHVDPQLTKPVFKLLQSYEPTEATLKTIYELFESTSTVTNKGWLKDYLYHGMPVSDAPLAQMVRNVHYYLQDSYIQGVIGSPSFLSLQYQYLLNKGTKLPAGDLVSTRFVDRFNRLSSVFYNISDGTRLLPAESLPNTKQLIRRRLLPRQFTSPTPFPVRYFYGLFTNAWPNFKDLAWEFIEESEVEEDEQLHHQSAIRATYQGEIYTVMFIIENGINGVVNYDRAMAAIQDPNAVYDPQSDTVYYIFIPATEEEKATAEEEEEEEEEDEDQWEDEVAAEDEADSDMYGEPLPSEPNVPLPGEPEPLPGTNLPTPNLTPVVSDIVRNLIGVSATNAPLSLATVPPPSTEPPVNLLPPVITGTTAALPTTGVYSLRGVPLEVNIAPFQLASSPRRIPPFPEWMVKELRRM